MTQPFQGPVRKSEWPALVAALLTWAAMLAVIVLALYAAIVPPTSLPVNGPLDQFSAQRALALSAPMGLRVPHPIGSAQLTSARSHLVERLQQLGLEVHEESATALSRSGQDIQVGLVTNIVARLPGSQSTRPVLLTTHYDSSEHSPGAAADGAGVIVILEVLRALRSGPPLRNDVVVLFTDGQDTGSLGATYAARFDHSLENAGLVIDISNYGNAGVPLLLGTSNGNHRLLRLFARDAPFPSASSLVYEFRDLLFTPTDFDVVRTLKGTPAISFGAVGGAATYHQATDTQSHLSTGLVQQLGANCLALARSQGNEDLRANSLLASRDDVFFNYFGRFLVHYPRQLVVPLLVVSLLVFGLLLRRAFKGDRHWLRDLAQGMFGALVLFLSAPVSMLCLWWCVDRITPATLLSSSATARLLLSLSFLVCGFAAASAVYIWLRRNIRTTRLMEASLILSALLVADMTMAFRESSYICFWPWFAGVIVSLGLRKSYPRTQEYKRAKDGGVSTSAQLISESDAPLTRALLAFLGALPAMLLLPFLFYLFFQFTHLDPTFMVCGGLLLGGALLINLPLLELLTPPQLGWKMPAVLALLCLTLLGTGFMKRAPSAAYPLSDSLLYALNTDTGKAAWVSLYAGEAFSLDKWLQQSLTHNPTNSRLPKLLGGYDSYVLSKAAAPPKALPTPPSIEVQDISGTGPEHLFKLHLTQSAASREIRIHLPATKLESVSIGDQKLDTSDPVTPDQQTGPDTYVAPKPWAIHVRGFPEKPIDLWLHLHGGECKMLAAERSPGLPLRNGAPVPPRPAEYAPARVTDDTVLSRTLSFCR